MAIGMLTGFDREGKIVEIVFECYDQTPKVSNSITFAGGLINVNRFDDGSFGGSIGGFGINNKKKSSMKILTFEGFKRQAAGRWSEYQIIGKKPILEFDGPGLEEVSFTVFLSTALGLDVATELKNLRRIRDEGIYCVLLIGEDAVTENFFVLSSIEEDHKYFDGKGNLLVASVNISLKEYLERTENNGG